MHRGNTSPLVTIVTPSYNQAEFLEYTICSVLAQDYPAIEYLVVDGASTDNSVEIIRAHSKELHWWVSEADQGQADAINKGLRRAQGEIVAWLNSDDLYLPGAVSHAVAVLQGNPNLGMVYGDAITIDDAGRPLNQLVFPDWALDDLMAFRIICQPAVFMRRSIVEAAGLLDEKFHFMLDHQLWLRIAKSAPIKHVPAKWAAARKHLAAKNVSQAEQFSRETFHVLAWMENQSDLAPLVERCRRKIQGGAYRLSARYLLDGGLYKEALITYSRALLTQPRYAMKHWHRMLYAGLSLVGGSGLNDWYNRNRRTRRPDLSSDPDLQEWVGLNIKD